MKEIFFTSVMLDVRGDVFFPDFWMEYLTIDQETMLRDDVVEIGGKKQIVGYYIYHLVRK